MGADVGRCSPPTTASSASRTSAACPQAPRSSGTARSALHRLRRRRLRRLPRARRHRRRRARRASRAAGTGVRRARRALRVEAARARSPGRPRTAAAGGRARAGGDRDRHDRGRRDGSRSAGAAGRVSLREVRARVDLDRIAALESQIWSTDRGWLADGLEARAARRGRRAHDPRGRGRGHSVVSAGWVRFIAGSGFATLWGGGRCRRGAAAGSTGRSSPTGERRPHAASPPRGRCVGRQPSDPRPPRVRRGDDDDAVHLEPALQPAA